MTAGLHWIRLVTPTTDDRRMPTVLKNTSGFVYYVSIAGITGTRSASADVIRSAVRRLRSTYGPSSCRWLWHPNTGTGRGSG